MGLDLGYMYDWGVLDLTKDRRKVMKGEKVNF